MLSRAAVMPQDSPIDRWMHHHGPTAVRLVLLAAIVLPILVAIVAAFMAEPEVQASGSNAVTASTGLVAFIATLVRGAVVSFIVLVNLVCGLVLMQLARGRILPRWAGYPVLLVAGAGMLLLDGDLLGLTRGLYSTEAKGWLGVSILAALFGLLGAVLTAWLSTHLIKMVLQPRVWATFIRHRLATISLAILTLLVLAAVTYPLADMDGKRFNDMDDGRKQAGAMSTFAGPDGSAQALLLGGDDLGRDLALRLWRGARVSLAVGLIASTISALLGLVIGAIAGYYGDLIDALLMRFLDMMLSIPVIAVMVILAAINLPDQIARLMQWENPELLGLNLSVWNIVLIVVMFGWMTVARLVRGEVLKQKQEVYVEAARAAGLSDTHILWGHVIPNCMGPLIVATTLSIGSIILYESALSYLGLGIQPPEVSWGKMVDDGRRLLSTNPQLVMLPGLAILLTVVSFNFLGDGLRDALDPRHASQGHAGARKEDDKDEPAGDAKSANTGADDKPSTTVPST